MEHLMDPVRRIGFDGPDQLRDRQRAAERDQQVNVIGHAADFHRDPAVVAYDAAKVWMQALGQVVDDPGLTMLGAENDVNINRREGLRHDWAPDGDGCWGFL